MYEDAAAYVFEHTQDCRLVTYAESMVDLDGRSCEVPSWCPDWRDFAPTQSLTSYFDGVTFDINFDGIPLSRRSHVSYLMR